METLSKPLCKYGIKCFRKNADHLKNFNHFTEEKSSEIKKNIEIIKKEKFDEKIDSENFSEKENIENRRESLEKNPGKKRKLSNEKTDGIIDKIDLTKVTDIKELVLEYNQMQMPEDFYELLEFCKSINPENPKDALSIVDIELVGIYDLILSGSKFNYKTHSRYFFDPPEFQTILSVTHSDSLLHFGYFRDEPKEMPSFVATNEAKLDGKIYCKGDNIFSAINWYINELISKKTYSANISSKELNEFKNKFNKWCDEHHKNDKKFSLQLKTPRIKSREKKINCKTIHGVGIVVPVDSRDFGYREVPETLESQKKMFTNCCFKNEKDMKNPRKIKGEDSIDEIITLIQFANDETDYGMGIEFGMNMFSFGELELHKYIKATLPLCYKLLNRDLFADILREHLKIRKLIN